MLTILADGLVAGFFIGFYFMALLIIISSVVTFSALGQPHTNYVASVERVKFSDCENIKKSLAIQAVVVDCIKESK